MARDTYNPGSGGSPVLLVTGPYPVALPEGLSGFTGDLTRAGRDLLVEMPDGTALRLVDYFTHGAPDLVHVNDAVLPGTVAERLAGPLAPGQYAQAGGADLGAPIGQVETLEGSAEVQRADGTVVALRVGTEIFANDLVTTGEGSTAALTFLDGTVFTLAADSRMLIDNLIYDPNGGQNASGFNLIQGGFVFIAGAIAPTGNMEVTTPTASMGIRGTTVSVEIRTDEGVTRVQVALNPDPDGGLGRIELFDLQGNLLGTITTTDISWIVSPVEGETRVLERSFAPDSPESALLDTAIRAFQSAITRAQSGSATQTDGSGTPDVILDFGEDGSFDEDIFGDDEGGDALIDLIRDIVDGDDTVTLPNLAPVAVPIDAGSVAETAAPVVIDLLAGQRDPNGDTLSIADVTVTAGGTAVAFTLDGTVVTIDPAQFIGLGTGEQADITIRYSLSDGTLSVENTATLTVTGVNTAPEASPINAGTVAETADPVVIDLLAGATDAEGDTLSVQDVVVTVGEGTATFSLEGGVLTLDPAQFVGLGAEESAEVSISYRISDGENPIDSTATLTVTGVNTAPEASPIDAGTVAETADSVVIDLLAGATDAEGDTLSVQDVVVTVGEGTASFSLEGGVLTLDPGQFVGLGAEESAEVSISYRISDGENLIDNTATLTVTGVNTAPEATPIDAGTVAETADPVVIDLLANATDAEGDTLSVQDVVVTVGEGTASFSLEGGVLTLDPGQFVSLGAEESAEVSISYRISDGENLIENIATLTVTGVNTAPETSPIDAGTVAETAAPVVIDLLAGASDAEGDTLSVQDVVVTVGEGTATFSLEGGVLTLDPGQFVSLGAEESAEVSISYRISDGENLIDNTATLTVTGVNTAPEATPIDAGTVAETADPVVIDLLANATDAEGDTLSVQDVVVTVGEGTATFSLEGGVLTLDPGQFGDLEPGETRSVSIAYRISDGAHLVDATASLTVEGTNTAPVVADVTIPAATVLAGGGFDASPDFDGWTASTATTGLISVGFSTAGVDRSGTALSDGDDAVAVLRFSGTASSFGGTGSGPTLTSDLVAVQAGDTLRVTYDLIAGALTGTWDNGGMIAELVDGSGTVVETLFSDAVTVGSSTGLQTLDLTLTQTGTYGVRFTLQSTDGTFGGVVGAELRIGEATLTRAGATESAPYSFDAALLTDGASDPDGGTVALLSVAGTSTAGARVSLAEGRISYDPDGAWDHLAAGETGTDTFTFTVSDGQGGTTTATATITVAGEGAGAELFAGAPLLDDLITLPDLSGFEAVIVNGFSGVDTAAFTAGPADPFGTVDLRGIEVLDLTNGAADDVTVTLADLLGMSDEADTRLRALLGDPVDAAGGVYRTILGEAGDTIRLAPSSGVDVGILPDGEGQAGGSYGGHTDVSVWQFTDSGTGEVLARLAIDDDVTTHLVAPT